MKKIIILFLLILVLGSLYACNSENNTDPGHNVVKDKEAHYLVFVVENIEIEKMLVVETDTFENLQVYFPVIPEREGYTSYWEEKAIYSSTQKEVYINAY
ncbi:MAG: hypothetical protein SPL07_07135, partial [Bacteroidales bacterium]|nr:hypothetical protein [Bacteroidales bacterium]